MQKWNNKSCRTFRNNFNSSLKGKDKFGRERI